MSRKKSLVKGSYNLKLCFVAELGESDLGIVEFVVHELVCVVTRIITFVLIDLWTKFRVYKWYLWIQDE